MNACAVSCAVCHWRRCWPPVAAAALTQAAADPLAEVPASASQSSAGMASYMGTLATLPADSREPITVDGFDPARPDDTEPEAVGGLTRAGRCARHTHSWRAHGRVNAGKALPIDQPIRRTVRCRCRRGNRAAP